jgi:membrane protein implicated in regulation of membrane protease activity
MPGVSPWWWVALAILLAAAEMVTITTVLVWAALAALLTAILLWLVPGLDAFAQVGTFAALSIVFFFVGRALVARYGQPGGAGGDPSLNRRAGQLVGRAGVVLVFARDTGKVTVDGIPWPARLASGATAPTPGDRVTITAVDGIVVLIAPLPAG